jgi:hypothetical protein
MVVLEQFPLDEDGFLKVAIERETLFQLWSRKRSTETGTGGKALRRRGWRKAKFDEDCRRHVAFLRAMLQQPSPRAMTERYLTNPRTLP